MNISLRLLLSVLGALAFAGVTTSAAVQGTAGIGRDFKGPLGLQLYSLRDQFAKDVPGTLKLVRDMGFKYVELAGTYGLSPEEFRKQLDAQELIPVAGHFPYERYRDDIEGVAREALALGISYAGCAWIPHEGSFDEKECRDAIAVFNRAGEALHKRGIQFYYHTHGYEFEPNLRDSTLFDLLLTETKSRYVRYQMDVLWVVHPGQDPVALLKKYGKRFELMHIKDLKKGVRGDLTGHTDVTNDVALGTGQVDLPAVLKAAKRAGVKWYFIEDESPTVLQQIPQSLRFLEQVRF